MELSYILENGNTEKNFLYFRKRNFFMFRKMKTPKKSFIFQETDTLIFQEELTKPQKPNFLIFFQKKL